MSKNIENASSSTESIISLLSPTELNDAITYFLENSPGAPVAIADLAHALNFREKFVQQRPQKWKVDQLIARITDPTIYPFAIGATMEYLNVRNKSMICEILDLEGVTHVDGIVDDNAPAPSVAAIVEGLSKIRGRFDDRDLFLYYVSRAGVTKNAAYEKAQLAAIEEKPFEDLGNTVLKCSEQSTATHAPKENEETANREPETSDEFTTLDNWLIRTAVATATGIEGAPTADGLEDIVQEVATLGVDRQRSYFHIGYIGALFDRGIRTDFTGTNFTQRSWILTGYLMGRLRSTNQSGIIEVIKENRKTWDELLDKGPTSAKKMLLPHLLGIFSENCEWSLLRRLLEQTDPSDDKQKAEALWIAVFERVAELVRRGSAVEARPVLQILLNHLNTCTVFDQSFRSQGAPRCLRKLGQTFLRDGKFNQAQELLKKALDEPNFDEAANARTDLGLAAAGFRSLDFLLPTDNTAANDTTIKSLEGQIAFFREAIECGGTTTNAQFVLGLIAFHRAQTDDAEQRLSNSLAGMLEKEDAYQAGFLLDWVKFLLAIIIAERCEPARLGEVRNFVESGISSRASFPLEFWARLCRATSLYDDKSIAERIIYHLLEKRGNTAYRLLRESGLLTKNADLRQSYQRWLETCKISSIKRAAELELLLDAALNENLLDEAAQHLDALEGVAKTAEEYGLRFISILRARRDELCGIWSEIELDSAEAELLERSNKFDECAVVLKRLFYRYRQDGDWDATNEIVNQLEHLKTHDADVILLKSQIEHLRPILESTETHKAALSGVRVLYVGGNETQMRYEKEIQRKLNDLYPGIVITCYFPGWTSNWNDHLEKIKRILGNSDVVVINRFVRTQLGRHLREECDKGAPWRACTGHGRDSILHAIEAAAIWIASIRAK